jgi:death-on-curing protein
MIRYLTLSEILELHRLIIELFGGIDGIRDKGGLEMAIAQPCCHLKGMNCIEKLFSKINL